MAFEVIPALDVSGGRLVRMSGGDAIAVDAFGGDPLVAASAFVEAGAARLHVVDVDLARTGTPGNLETVRAVASLGSAVQASGVVRSAEQASALLDAGAGRVVLGSAALLDRSGTEKLVASLGDRLCVGIEAAGAEIRPRGTTATLALWDTVRWLGELAVPRFVLTDVARVGELAGPDLDGIWALATTTGRPVIASGGIRSVDDLTAIARLGGTVEGAIVGRALQEGLDLRSALAAVA